MKFKVLVTIDLPDVSEDQRKKFYDVLTQEKWIKIKNLTTAWKVTFAEGVTRQDAISAIQTDLQKAKSVSSVRKVDYAIQLDIQELIISNL